MNLTCYQNYLNMNFCVTHLINLCYSAATAADSCFPCFTIVYECHK